MHRGLHHLPGPWSGNLIEGATGHLVQSKSRALRLLALGAAGAGFRCHWAAPKLRHYHLIVWLLLALIPYLLLFSKYAVWWGGHCFGPRYWTDVMPLLAVLLAFGLDWAVGAVPGLVVRVL